MAPVTHTGPQRSRDALRSLQRSLRGLLALLLLTSCGTPARLGAAAPLPTAVIALAPTSAAPTSAPSPSPSATPRPTATPPSPTATPSPSPAAPTPTADPTGDPTAREAQLEAAINQVRVANGLPPYAHSPELAAAARAHSCDLASHAIISHTSSDGRTLRDRLAGSNPPWEWPSESIAAGLDDPAAVVALWMDEPPEGWHRRNILDPDQRDVGAGFCYTAQDPSGNHFYWTADFARRGS